MKKHRTLIGITAACQLVLGSSQVLAQDPDVNVGPVAGQIRSLGDDELDAALALFREGTLAAAELEFARIADKGRGTRWGEQARFHLAETQFRLKKYAQAYDSFEALIAEYPGTEFLGKLVAREFAIAVRWLSKDHASALKTLQRIRFHHPDSPLATSALIEIAVHYLKLKNEAEAKLYYEQLISDHPEGSWLIDLFRLQQLQRTARQEQLEAARAVNPGGQAEKVGRGEQNPPVPDASFDDWAFAAKPGADRFHDQVDVLLKNKLEGLLTRKVDEVEQMFLLTAAQRQKLRLAGHGDIKRLLDSVEEARREFDLAKQDVDRLSEVRNKLRTVDLLMTSGPFDFGSLFHKTLRKMFDEKQLKRRSTRVKTTSVGA